MLVRYPQKSIALMEGSKTSPIFPPHNTDIKLKMGLEQWWNDTDGGKPKYWERNLSQRHFVHQKYHMDRPGIETGPPSGEDGI
jgi:hypothetical protein